MSSVIRVIRVIRSLTEFLDSLEIECDESVTERLSEYVALLQRYGKRINLIGDLSNEFIWQQIILGSLQMLRLGRPRGRLVDVGSGAGVPAVPLAIVLGDLDVTAVDIRQKRITFLGRVRDLLDLKNLHVCERSADELPAAQWQTATARAFRPPTEWMQLGHRLVDGGGMVVVMTNQNAWAGARRPSGLTLTETLEDETHPGRLLVGLVKSG